MKFPNVQNAVTSTQISTAINSLKRHNIVNSKYIAIQIYMRVDTPWGTLLLIYGTHRATRTTAFVMTLFVFLKVCKCNISITNCQIALKLYTGVKHQKVHKKCQWLDKHPNCIRNNTFCIPNFVDMQYLHQYLSDCSKIVHRGAVPIEEYIHVYRVNIAHMVI